MKDKAVAIVSLFASTGTLFCCALPTLLVTLGLGAVVAGAISSLPWLVPLSQHKEWVFLAAGLLISGNWMLAKGWDRRAATQACEVPGHGGETACQVASRFSRAVLWVSTGLYAVGFVVAFVAYPVAEALGWL